MTLAIAAIGLLILAMSLFGMIAPGGFRGLMHRFLAVDQVIAFAAGIRLVMGAIFILGADATRVPIATQIIGWITIAAAIGVVFMGRERMVRFAEWWLRRPDVFLRTWLIAGIAFGAFIVWLGLPQGK